MPGNSNRGRPYQRRNPAPAAAPQRRANLSANSNRGQPYQRRNSAPATAAVPPSNFAPTLNPTPESQPPPPPPETLASQSSFKIMGQVEAPMVLLDPRGVSGGIALGSCATADSATHDLTTDAFASADKSVLLPGAKFGFQLWGATLVFQVIHPSGLVRPDEWGPRPIQFFVKVLCADRQLVLLRLSSTDIGSQTEFFVYRFPSREAASATIVKLPEVPHGILASESFGLVRHRSDRDEYVVANLQRQFNPKTGHIEVFLHRWWCNDSSWQSEMVNLPTGIDIGKLQTDQVVTSPNPLPKKLDYLLWVDLSQRCIIRCRNPLQKGKANGDLIWFPHMNRVPRRRTFSSVGCCNGKLKLANIDIIDDETVHATIKTLDERSSPSSWSWTKTTSCPLNCTDLLAAMKTYLPASQVPSDWKVSENHMPCFSVLSPYKDNILYVIIARKDGTSTWLLEVKVTGNSWHLEDAAAYPGFSNHQKPPYSSNCF